MRNYLPSGIHVEYRVALDEDEGQRNHYPAHKGDDPRIWTDPSTAYAARRARVERRVTVSFALPWLPSRWRSGAPVEGDEDQPSGGV